MWMERASRSSITSPHVSDSSDDDNEYKSNETSDRIDSRDRRNENFSVRSAHALVQEWWESDECFDKTEQSTCFAHVNSFALVGNDFAKCALRDQLTIFHFVDRFVDCNHVIYFLMREILTTKARIRIKCSNGKIRLAARRNVVLLLDGVEKQFENETRNDVRTTASSNVDAFPSIQANETERLTVKPVRNYESLITRLNFNGDNKSCGSNNSHKRMERWPIIRPESTYRDDYNDDDSSASTMDDTDSSEEDTNRNDRTKQDDIGRAERTMKRKRKSCDEEKYRNRKKRNARRFFGRSKRSIAETYNAIHATIVSYRRSCVGKTFYEHERDQTMFRHINYDCRGNNISNANKRIAIGRSHSNDSKTSAELYSKPSSTTDRTKYETESFHCSTDEFLEIQSINETSTTELNETVSRLWALVVTARNSMDNFIRKRNATVAIDLDSSNNDFEADRTRSEIVRETLRKDPSNATYAVTMERELSLPHLKNVVKQCTKLALTRCTKLIDMVIHDEHDAWWLFNNVLDHGLQTYRDTGFYPVRQSMWNIIFVGQTEHRHSTVEKCGKLSNYKIIRENPSGAMMGDLTSFVLSFQKLLRMIVGTCCSYFLNRKQVNTRKSMIKHACVLPKASQGTYYSLFLRMQLGHELLCISQVSNDTEAEIWLRKYHNLNERLNVKRRFAKSILLLEHLQQLRASRRGNDSSTALSKPFANRTATKEATVNVIETYDRATTLGDMDDNESLLDYAFDE